ncbi:hypothetical protein [Helicobacter cetorum]|uniref:hypothetical protein n=1 Tax=Helicobacter cetorum TaxID=138563 RepID=UPI000CF0F295|nr:hypothetical protein [Helicobacter cetorum]
MKKYLCGILVALVLVGCGPKSKEAGTLMVTLSSDTSGGSPDVEIHNQAQESVELRKIVFDEGKSCGGVINDTRELKNEGGISIPYIKDLSCDIKQVKTIQITTNKGTSNYKFSKEELMEDQIVRFYE